MNYIYIIMTHDIHKTESFFVKENPRLLFNQLNCLTLSAAKGFVENIKVFFSIPITSSWEEKAGIVELNMRTPMVRFAMHFDR